MSERIRKVNELIKHVVADALKQEGTSGLLTVKAVETTRDMKHADVWISVIGNEEETMTELEEKRKELQSAVARMVQAKHVPALHFRLDHSGAYAQRIEELLKDDRTES